MGRLVLWQVVENQEVVNKRQVVFKIFLKKLTCLIGQTGAVDAHLTHPTVLSLPPDQSPQKLHPTRFFVCFRFSTPEN